MSFIPLRHVFVSFFMTCFLLLSSGLADRAAGQFYINQDESLAGMEAVLLVVEFSGNAEAADSLDAARLEQETAGKLREAGFRLLSERAWAQAEGQPYLNLRINSIDSGLGFFVYRIEASLHQQVRLLRQPDKTSIVPTWEAAELGFAGANRLGSIQADLLRLVDTFIEAYQQENSNR